MAENKLLLYKDHPEDLIGRWVLRSVGNPRIPQRSLHKIARVTKQTVTLTNQDRYKILTAQRAQSKKPAGATRYNYTDEIQLLTTEEAKQIQEDWKNAAEHRKLLDELRPRLAVSDLSTLKEVIALLDSKLLTPHDEENTKNTIETL